MSEESRRDRLCIEAFNPDDRKTCIVQISQQRLLTIKARGLWAIKEAAEIVPMVLERPIAVFQGLRREEDEDRSSAGWRCYCGHPSKAFRKDGKEIDPYPNQVFLVFVNDEGVAYNWRWEPADLDCSDFPKGHAQRFRTTVYYEGDD
jgi:hypothetical protein